MDKNALLSKFKLWQSTRMVVFVSTLFISGFAEASVYKCASKEPQSGLVYIAATRESVAFHFTGNWEGRLFPALNRLFIDELGTFPSNLYAHSFEFALARQNCQVGVAGIDIQCDLSDLIDPTAPRVIDEHGTLQNYSMLSISQAQIYLKKQISPVGLVEYLLDLTLKNPDNSGEIFHTMDCVH